MSALQASLDEVRKRTGGDGEDKPQRKKAPAKRQTRTKTARAG
jgi:hypothetical protein